MNLDSLGRFPSDGNEARRKREIIKISRENFLRTIHGREHPVLMNFFVSNDVVHMGEIVIPRGGEGPRVSEPDSHAGDAVIYVESGPITFYLPGTQETFLINEGEAMFLPEGTRYQCINYNSKVVKCIFLIGPGL